MPIMVDVVSIWAQGSLPLFCAIAGTAVISDKQSAAAAVVYFSEFMIVAF
jgi:hypothetical protein